MSTEQSTRRIESIESRLEAVLSEYQQKHRYTELDKIADKMEGTVLQQRLANTLFEGSIEIDEDAQAEVQEIMEYVERGDIEYVESGEVASLRQTVTSEEKRITEQIQSLRFDHRKTVRAFVKLNQEVDAVDNDRLNALQSLLEHWDWENMLTVGADASLDEKVDEAVEVGNLMSGIYQEAIDAFGEAFGNEEVQSQVDTLINGEAIEMDTLTQSQLSSLLDTKVSPYIELSLSDHE